MSTASNLTQNVKEKAKDVAANATDKAKDLASDVSNKAGQIASDVSHKAGQIASAVGDRAESAAASVGSGMKTVADTIREHTPNKGMLGDASQSVAGALESGGRFLEEKGLSGVGDEVTGLIKKHPVPAVLLALGLGYLIACSTRS